MDINYKFFQRLHKYGQDLLFDKIHNKLKVVLEDKNHNQFIADGLLSKYSDRDRLENKDILDLNKTYIKFRVSDLKKLYDIKEKKYRLNFREITTIILDGYRYNVYNLEVNNQSRDYLILEITKYKN